jgi:hypothetical protein
MICSAVLVALGSTLGGHLPVSVAIWKRLQRFRPASPASQYNFLYTSVNSVPFNMPMNIGHAGVLGQKSVSMTDWVVV